MRFSSKHRPTPRRSPPNIWVARPPLTKPRVYSMGRATYSPSVLLMMPISVLTCATFYGVMAGYMPRLSPAKKRRSEERRVGKEGRVRGGGVGAGEQGRERGRMQ